MRLLDTPQREDPSVLQLIYYLTFPTSLSIWFSLPDHDLELHDTVYVRKNDRSFDKYKQWDT